MEAIVYALIGLAVAFLTSVVKQDGWSEKIKQSTATALAIIGGVVTAYFQAGGSVELSSALQSSAILLAVAQLVYAYGLRDTKLNKFLTGLHLESTLDKSETVEEAQIELVQEVVKEAVKRKPKTVKKAASKDATE